MARFMILALCLCSMVLSTTVARAHHRAHAWMHHHQNHRAPQNNALNAIIARAGEPLSPKMIAKIKQLHMTVDSPVLIRIFKREKTLEVWKQNDMGRFVLLETYAVCRLSGGAGPKLREGDRQSPEGFYTVTPDLMHPLSHAYLAFNIGFPNTYDQANGRTGSFVMVHGNCASIGCFAMTNRRMIEIYALIREAFAAPHGQDTLQVQIFPFRMTEQNMRTQRRSKHYAFWSMLKEGSDRFEMTKLEPRVDVCDRHYVFDARTDGEFKPTEPCPPYTVPDDAATAQRGQ